MKLSLLEDDNGFKDHNVNEKGTTLSIGFMEGKIVVCSWHG
jgi:hypothetical protein